MAAWRSPYSQSCVGSTSWAARASARSTPARDVANLEHRLVRSDPLYTTTSTKASSRRRSLRLNSPGGQRGNDSDSRAARLTTSHFGEATSRTRQVREYDPAAGRVLTQRAGLGGDVRDTRFAPWAALRAATYGASDQPSTALPADLARKHRHSFVGLGGLRHLTHDVEG